MPKRVPVSDAELEVLKVLWAGGAMTVRDVAAGPDCPRCSPACAATCLGTAGSPRS